MADALERRLIVLREAVEEVSRRLRELRAAKHALLEHPNG